MKTGLYFTGGAEGEPAAEWLGKRIGDVSYPRNIGTLWSDADLAAIGLARPLAPDAVPDGKRSRGKAVQTVGGVPKWVHTLEDIPPTYATAEEAKAAMIAWADAFNATVTGPVPADEKLAWVYKDAAARAIDAGGGEPDQLALIDAEAAITGETRADLAAKIIERSNLYRQVVAAVSGLRRKTGAAIDAASDPYNYDAILAAAQAEAEALAASLGL